MSKDKSMCKYEISERCTHTLALCDSCYIYKKIKKDWARKEVDKQ